MAAYSAEDFDEVFAIARQAAGIVLCPNVMTEASNLVRHAPSHIGDAASAVLAGIARDHAETYVPTIKAAAHPAYRRLGVTDAVLLTLTASGGTLLTADLDLYLAALQAGHAAQNYNHIRERRLFGR